MTHVHEINDPAQLEPLRLVWQSLLLRTRGATFFQSLDWLMTYWGHYGAEQRLRVLVVEAAGDVIGIVPLVVRRQRTRLGTIRALTYPLDCWGSFYGPITSQPAATLAAALRYLQSTERDWDVIDLPWVDADGSDARRTATALATVGLPTIERTEGASSQIELRGTWDEYWRGRSKHFRGNIRRAEQTLAAHGTVEFVRYRPTGVRHDDDAPRFDLYDACEQVAAASWQADRDDGTTITSPAIRDFLREMHVTACRAGAADVALLKVNGQPAAFAYGYQGQGNVFGLRMGFDPRVSKSGAGSVLLRHWIADSFARGDTMIDLGVDYVDCKRHWRTRSARVARYTHFGPGLRASALRAARHLRGWWQSRSA
ncbi:MAG: GNAT family N-acetyltransferase [Planctomycetes bacterium]|nr:GNAT family N-acetyltransferase [Planctomycetota bacterium]